MIPPEEIPFERGIAAIRREPPGDHPRCPHCLEAAAGVQGQIGRWTAACKVQTKAPTGDPRNASYRYDRAIARLRSGRLRGAVRDFTRISRNRGLRMLAAEGRGRARALAGDLPGGIKDLSRAIGMRPDGRDILFHRGLVRFLPEDLRAAERDLKASGVKAARRLTSALARTVIRRGL